MMPPKLAFPKAKEAVLKSLQLEETDRARTALAGIRYFFDWDWPAFEREIKRAFELKSNSAHHLNWRYLNSAGRFDEGGYHARRASELEPNSPLFALAPGKTLYYSRAFDRAIAEFRKVVEAFPDFAPARLELGWALSGNGQHAEAAAAFQDILQLQRDHKALAGLSVVLARSGQKEQALKTLGELNVRRREAEQTQSFYCSPFHLALVHAALGDNPSALDWLEKGYDERSFLMTLLKVEPALDPLRSEPRFKALLKQMNLEK